MLYIKRGSFTMGQNDQDAKLGDDISIKDGFLGCLLDG